MSNLEENFLTKSKFTKLIETTVSELKISYMDAVLHLCEENYIEPEDVKKFILYLFFSLINLI